MLEQALDVDANNIPGESDICAAFPPQRSPCNRDGTTSMPSKNRGMMGYNACERDDASRSPYCKQEKA